MAHIVQLGISAVAAVVSVWSWRRSTRHAREAAAHAARAQAALDRVRALRTGR